MQPRMGHGVRWLRVLKKLKSHLECKEEFPYRCAATAATGVALLATPKSAKHKGLKMQVKTEHRHIHVAHRFSRRPR